MISLSTDFSHVLLKYDNETLERVLKLTYKKKKYLEKRLL